MRLEHSIEVHFSVLQEEVENSFLFIEGTGVGGKIEGRGEGRGKGGEGGVRVEGREESC